jgi:uncharacterized protein (DUF2249 family)
MNRALSARIAAYAAQHAAVGGGTMMTDTKPDALVRIAADHVVELDVRAELRAGREPFSLIMEALARVPEGGALAVRAIFEPVPLYRVLGRQGFKHWTESAAPDDWTVWFFRAPSDAAAASDAPEPVVQAEHADDDDVVVLDVRGLEPPEPMLRTLAALEGLPPGATLVQLNVRVPQFLLPLLEERGYSYEIREQDESLVRVFIRYRTP